MSNSRLFTKITYALLITGATQASEYIVSNYDDNNKPQICDIVSKYRFPSILSPFIQKEFENKYPNLDLMETFKTKESEHQFIQNAVQKIDPKAKVYTITKSLYQFIVYNYFAETIDYPEKDSLQTLFSQCYEYKRKFELCDYAKANEEWSLTKACNNFMQNKDIRDIFWKVNDYANDLYIKCDWKIETIVEKLLNAYTIDEQLDADGTVIRKEPKRLFDWWNTNQQSGKNKSDISHIETLLGTNWDGRTPTGWNEEKRLQLKNYIKNIIVSEAENPKYVLYHAGKFDKPDPEMANRMSICFSDGLGSGYIFDAGASAFVLSGGVNKLYRLELERTKLLAGQYPIFIPPAQHLLSGAGNGELFHVRTKLIQAIIPTETNSIDKCAMSIKSPTKPITPGYQLNQTPEYFTTQNPQILKQDGPYGHYTYEKTSLGVFDQKGAEALANMLKDIKEVNEDGTF